MLIALALGMALVGAAGVQASGAAPLEAVPHAAVRIADEFWRPRQEVNATATLAHNFEQCRATGRIANLERAARREAGGYEGYFFNDSDVYKAIEGACHVLAHRPDPALEAMLDGLIATIGAAQHDDGYINSYFTIAKPEERWTNTRDMHELYCIGHLIEAGVAHHEATGKRTLLDVAIRAADHVEARFGAGRSPHTSGHEEIELALIKLARATGEQRYADLARELLERRGRAEGRELYGEFCQDLLPVREHREAVGHAVRATYLYAAMADVAMRTGDRGYIDAMERVWEDLTARKMYVTGGIGSSPHNEGFTVAYDLPNDSSYAETCAGIGLVMWAHRLGLLHADARYIDVMERALYNAVLSGVSLDGTRFFYVNPLASRGDKHRRDWYACACCPPNILRLIASLGGYVYARSDEAVYVNLYVGGAGRVALPGGAVVIEQQTRYPWDGDVRITVRPEGERRFDLMLRVPGWSRSFEVAVNGEPRRPAVEKGYARIAREWSDGDVVEVRMPMPVERLEAHPRVEANVGRVALQRGPIVYCLESADNLAGAAGRVRSLALPRTAALAAEHRSDLLGGVTIVRGRALLAEPEWDDALYRPAEAREVEFTAIPYYAWDNREPGEMVVWIPESPALVEPGPLEWLRPSASHCWGRDTLSALHDRIEPTHSADQSIPRFTWWPRRGSREWVQYDFDRPRTVSSVEVYWFDDSGRGGGCKPPAAWRLAYRDGDEWKDVDGTAVEPRVNAYTRVEFAPVRTDGLRIEVELREGASAGILEWRVGESR